MGRRSYYDTDEERLPEGVRRVGYDADTQTYSYRDSRGRGYTSAPGVQYGRLFRTRAETVPAAPTSTNPFRTPSQTSKASDEPPKYLKERYVYLAPAGKESEQRSPPTTFSQIFENAEEDDAALPPQHNKDIEEKPSRARSMRYRQRREAGNDATQQPLKRRTTVKKLFQAVHRSMTVSKSSDPRRMQPELHRDAMHRQNTI